ncbi:class I SAM-dependent methyltransferase [Halorubrum aethiopicum]|uniref:class I SAM-dependent methyltransferase n=1 Tax=Halorubrum aethiopicum TaxID=1758255 RepID=UPI0008325185|nr:class I SAM-dependent methyltransferase [Halorubrum aethiopicum]
MVLEPSEFFGNHAEEFDEANRLDELPDAFRSLLEAFEAELNGGAILDAGCGPGRDTEYFHTNGYDPIGIDISRPMIERARRTRPGIYQQMDIRHLAFDTDRFDGVWCPASIYFLPPVEMEAALREFRRVLTQGGVLHVGFKLGDGEDTQDRWDDSVTEYHLDEDTAETYVESNSFTIIETRTHSLPDRTFKSVLCRSECTTAAE